MVKPLKKQWREALQVLSCCIALWAFFIYVYMVYGTPIRKQWVSVWRLKCSSLCTYLRNATSCFFSPLGITLLRIWVFFNQVLCIYLMQAFKIVELGRTRQMLGGERLTSRCLREARNKISEWMNEWIDGWIESLQVCWGSESVI